MSGLAPGTVFGRWTVLGPASRGRKGSGGYRRRVRVECKCGLVKVVFEDDLQQEKTRGCKYRICQDFQRGRVIARALVHGMQDDESIELWERLLDRKHRALGQRHRIVEPDRQILTPARGLRELDAQVQLVLAELFGPDEVATWH